jgi:hypothetical protein
MGYQVHGDFELNFGLMLPALAEAELTPIKCHPCGFLRDRLRYWASRRGLGVFFARANT